MGYHRHSNSSSSKSYLQSSSWSSTFSSLSWKNLWKICLKSKNLHLFLHKLTRCIITAKKVYNRLSNLSSSKVINKRSSWSSTFSSLFLKILWKILYKIQQLALILHKIKRYIITATKWAIIDFLTRLLQKVINKGSSLSSTFSSLSWKID